VANRAANDSAAIDALMPGEPSGNDSLFVEALQTIQKNIGSAVLMDAMQAESGADPNGEQSQSRWSIVNSAVSELESATTATDLTAILNGEKITVVTEATPAPTPEAVTYQTLSKGAKSDAVLALQNRLYELGYLNDDRDGNFGNKTQTAVKLFQAAVGIGATGIADSATQERLFADDAPRNGGAVTPPPATAADDLFDTTAALPDDEDDFAIAYEFGNSEEDLA
ncbi:MAG: peptidoglycan-binding domain-containing protein, partial [bacterium]